MRLESSKDASANNASWAFLRDARHRNRFHIRRTKKGDIKPTETGKGTGVRAGERRGGGSLKRGDEQRGLWIPICVYILYTHAGSMNL
jgi:hypothetical protein